jgi:hypothetical protein
MSPKNPSGIPPRRRFAEIAGGVGAVLAVGLWLASASELAHLLAFVILVLWLLFALRLVLYFVRGWLSAWRHDESPVQQLAHRVVIEVVLCLVWLGVAVASWLWPSSLRETIALVILVPTVLLRASATAKAAKVAGLKRNTDLVRESDRAKRLYELAIGVAPMRWVCRNLPLITPPGDTSAYVNWIAVILVVVAAMNVPAAIKDVSKRLSSPQVSMRHKHHHRAQPPPAAGGSSSYSSQSSGESQPGRISDPPYGQQCAGDVAPGDVASGKRATEPAGRELYSLWLGSEIRDGLGATEAGCAQPAHRVPKHNQVWYAIGVCSATLRSLGVYAPGQPPAILLQQPAELAAQLAEEGRLLDASRRLEPGTGDLYVIGSTGGDIVEVRSQSATGPTASKQGTRPCEQFLSGNTEYTTVPTTLIALWLRLDNTAWTWPELVSPKGDPEQDFVFRRDEPSRQEVATASCTAEGKCTMLTEGKAYSNTTPERLTANELADQLQVDAPESKTPKHYKPRTAE